MTTLSLPESALRQSALHERTLPERTLRERARPERDGGRARPAPGVTVLPVARRSAELAPLATGLSRVRGGTFSPTVEVIHFTDGTSARTDLIRLNPNIDAYSLDFHGVSPRQLAHYREVGWASTHAGVRRELEPFVASVLAHGYPQRSTRELSDELRATGFDLGAGELKDHEAIAATQAALWWFTNGLELDTRRLDAPVRATSRTSADAVGRPVAVGSGPLHWRGALHPGEEATFEVELAEAFELRSFAFTVGPRAGRHEFSVHLEQSADGVQWTAVSRSTLSVPAERPGESRVVRPLGLGSTVSFSSGSRGARGHRFYRLVARGPADRDGFVDLRDIRLQVQAASPYRNSERIVALYRRLLDHAHGLDDHGDNAPSGEQPVIGPFTIAAPEPAFVSASQALVLDARGREVREPIAPGAPFYLHPRPQATEAIEIHVRPRRSKVAVLVGSTIPGGPSAFTPLAVLTTAHSHLVPTTHVVRVARP